MTAWLTTFFNDFLKKFICIRHYNLTYKHTLADDNEQYTVKSTPMNKQ